ncbi:MAG: hypothetical protein LUQ40_05715 [Methanomicrobiales archaeon]|nr:hypothetical protein [Methanomicrobiales archaeon]
MQVHARAILFLLVFAAIGSGCTFLQEPVVGTWEYSMLGIDIRLHFDQNGSFSMISPLGTASGTWEKYHDNEYRVRYRNPITRSEETRIFVYEERTKTVYELERPEVRFIRI